MDSRVTKYPSSFCLCGNTEEIRRFLEENEESFKESMLEAYIECCYGIKKKGKDSKGEKGDE